MGRRIVSAWVFAAVLGVVATVEAQAVRVTNPLGEPPQPADVLELFNAIQDGSVDARVIVRDQYHAKIVLENRTDELVSLIVPQYLAAQPILAQQGFFSGQNSGLSTTFGPSNNSGSGTPQSVGGMPSLSTNSSQNSFFNGGGPFNIAPEQIRTIDLPCFCLEQGKPNPRSAVKYALVPLEQANDDPRLPGLLAAHARGEIDRDSAQAAVWHAANDLSWDELARLSTRIALNAEKPLFNSFQLRKAKALVDAVASRGMETKRIATTAAEKSTGEQARPVINASPTKRTERRAKDRI